ncbi:hypothetical protein AgCh_002624 [Apium graveolens]
MANTQRVEEWRKFGAFDSFDRRRGGGFERDESWGKKREDVMRPKLNLGEEEGRERCRLLRRCNGGVVGAVKPKGSNLFGNARPREEVLKEKGQDWKEVDETLESLKLKEKEAAGLSDGPSFGKRSFDGKTLLMKLRREKFTELTTLTSMGGTLS